MDTADRALRWRKCCRPNILTAIGLFVVTTYGGLAQYQYAAGYDPVGDQTGSRVSREHYRLVKRLDFDERPLGNFEETPMHWRKLAGPGLPSYSRGLFDDKRGATAPPSFQFLLETGNIGYEYSSNDLMVIPQSDYLVSAQIRPNRLRHAAALVAAYLVDRYGERIPNSQRVSRLVRTSTAEGFDDPESEPWQTVELTLPGEYPDAHALRLQLWLLQNSTWEATDARIVDPIQRNDVRVGAWFDDVAIYRLPRARLSFSNPAGLVLPGRRESLFLDVNNATAQTLSARIRVFDADEHEVHTAMLEIPSSDSDAGRVASKKLERSTADHSKGTREHDAAGQSASTLPQLRSPLPELPPGNYHATLSVLGGGDSLLERRLRFAVLPPLPGERKPHPDLGIDLGAWRGGDPQGVVQAIGELYSGQIKIGIPLAPDPPQDEITRLLNGVASLLRDLAKRRVEATGVLLPRVMPGEDTATWSLHEFIKNRDGLSRLSPTFAHFGGMLPSWQVGAEMIELSRPGGWSEEMLSQTQEQLRRFVTSPELAAPVSVFATSSLESQIRSVWIPWTLPTRSMPRQLEPFVRSTARTWLRLQSPSLDEDPQRRLIELARRIALAKACGGERLVVDAPFRRTGFDVGGFEPTDDFIVTRTMLRFLGGKHLVGTLQPAPDVLALLFSSASESVMVLWSWREEAVATPVEMYLGPTPVLYGIDGLPRSIERNKGRSILRATGEPQIVVNLRSPQALLQASFEVTPRNIQLHDPDPRPVLRFRNPYDERIAGDVFIDPPDQWQISQSVVHFDLNPGETLEHPLFFSLPPQEVASEQSMGVRVQVRSPEDAILEFTERLTVGLHDIEVLAVPRWNGSTLVVSHTIRNNSEAVVRFSGFCSAAGRPRAEADFVDVRPGDSMTRNYIFSDAADLRGGTLHLGIQEIRGERRLNQLVEIPGQ